MKKIILGISLAMATTLSAQIDFSSTRFGVLAGGNYSRVSNAHNPSGALYTFQAGILAQIPIDSYDQFYIQPEVTYYGAGESGKDKDSKGKLGYNAKYANNYISVPIYFKAFFSEAESEFFGLFGPRFNFLLNQKIENPSREVYYPEGGAPYADNPSINGKANSFNWGLSGGIGYSYKRQFEIFARFDYGLGNTYPNMVENKSGDPNTENRKSEQVFTVGLSYIFE